MKFAVGIYNQIDAASLTRFERKKREHRDSVKNDNYKLISLPISVENRANYIRSIKLPREIEKSVIFYKTVLTRIMHRVIFLSIINSVIFQFSSSFLLQLPETKNVTLGHR